MTPKTLNARKLHLYEKSVQSSKKSEAAKKQWMRIRTEENVTDDESNIDFTSQSTAQEIPTENHETIQKKAGPDSSTIRSRRHRALSSLLPLLPKNVVDSLNLFVRCFNSIMDDDPLKEQLVTVEIPSGQLNYNQVYYLQNKVCALIESKNDLIQKEMFKAWLSRLLSHKAIKGL